MGYRTITRVPEKVRTYERAKAIHDNATPIRGRMPEVRPLGARRDADTYAVRMADEGVVEFTLYNVPVIRYFPDETISIKHGRHSCLPVQELLHRVLDINSTSRRGSLIVEIDGKKVVLGTLNNSEEIRLKLEKREGVREGMFTPEQGNARVIGGVDVDEMMRNLQKSDHVLTFVTPTEAYGYAVNKKRMKEVREMHSEFVAYMKGFISLRKHDEIVNRGSRWEHTIEVISFTTQELLDCFGAKILATRDKSLMQFIKLNEHSFRFELPGEYRNLSGVAKREAMALYEEKTGNFIAITKNGQDGDKRHKNFHKAAMMLLSQGLGMVNASPENLTTVSTTKTSGLMNTYDEVLKRWYRNTILEKIQLTDGKSPNMQYEQWMEEV